MAGFVYFIRAENGLIKVGFSAESPDRRLKELRQGNAVRLDRVALLLSGIPLEKLLHYRFDGCRSHCDWFHPADELTAFIAAHAWPWADPLPKGARRHGIPDRFKADGLFKADPWFKAEAARVAVARRDIGDAWWKPEGKAVERAASLLAAFPPLAAAMERATAPPKERNPPHRAGIDDDDTVTVVYRDGPCAGAEAELPRCYIRGLFFAGIASMADDGPDGYHRYRAAGEWKPSMRGLEAVDLYFTGVTADLGGRPLPAL